VAKVDALSPSLAATMRCPVIGCGLEPDLRVDHQRRSQGPQLPGEGRMATPVAVVHSSLLWGMVPRISGHTTSRRWIVPLRVVELLVASRFPIRRSSPGRSSSTEHGS